MALNIDFIDLESVSYYFYVDVIDNLLNERPACLQNSAFLKITKLHNLCWIALLDSYFTFQFHMASIFKILFLPQGHVIDHSLLSYLLHWLCQLCVCTGMSGLQDKMLQRVLHSLSCVLHLSFKHLISAWSVALTPCWFKSKILTGQLAVLSCRSFG